MTPLEVLGLVSAVLWGAAFALATTVVVVEIAREFARGLKPPRRTEAHEPHLRLVGAEVFDARARFAERRRQIDGAA